MERPKAKLNQKAKTVLYVLIIVVLGTAIFLILAIIFAIENHSKANQIKSLQQQLTTAQQTIDQPLQAYSKEVRQTLNGKGLNANLMLQKDERWNDLPYGWGKWKNYGHNACALACLTMVHATYGNGELTPDEVLTWAGNDYFTNQGTSWSIFPAFAEAFDYDIKNLGGDLQRAEDYLKDGKPVIASVKPGRFTYIGHVILLTSMDTNGFHLLDPNDDPFKRHSLIDWEAGELQDEIVNMWILQPK